jgi:tyrosinase
VDTRDISHTVRISEVLICETHTDFFLIDNWAWWSDDPRKSPLFDGSETSISDGGAYVGGRNYTCLPSEAAGCPIKLQPGFGGGCVSGPLANWTVTLGPIQTKVKGVKPNPQADGLGYNPRCISRDLNGQAAYLSRDEIITELIKNSKDVLSFQNRMQGDFPSGYLGVHSAGHYTIGGDAGSDFFNSPSDPVSLFPIGMWQCANRLADSTCRLSTFTTQ